MVADAEAIAAIGRVAFPAVHEPIVGAAAAAAVVEQTYSLEALGACITRCALADDAHFLVAEREGRVVGYLHYDCEAAEPELHRIYVDPGRKRGGIGSSLLRELHDRLGPGTSYILMVAEANRAALGFYRRHGFVEHARVDGSRHYRDTMGVELAADAPAVAALVLRFTTCS